MTYSVNSAVRRLDLPHSNLNRQTIQTSSFGLSEAGSNFLVKWVALEVSPRLLERKYYQLTLFSAFS
jgi:hypothetical protein